MTQITIDAELAMKLQQLTDAAELCDTAGRVVGRFVPQLDLSEWERCEPEISEEELQRREQSLEKRYSTAEVRAHLETL